MRIWPRTLFIGDGFETVDRSPFAFYRLIVRIISFQEFGDSARARKLYEQDSDDDDEDGELEPNPKLEAGEMVQSANGGTDRTPEDTRKEIIHNSHFPLCRSGNDLPRRFGDFPQEFVSTPICDIDPYYSDKRTFIVISKGGCIYRFSAEKAM